MIISCPQCATSFRADGSKIAPTGTKVRCAKCGHIWVQKPEEAAPAAAPKPQAKPAVKPEPAPAAAAPPPPPPAPEPPPEVTPTRAPFEEPPVVAPPEPEEAEDEAPAETPAERRARELLEQRALKAAERRDTAKAEKPRRKGGFGRFVGWVLFLAVLGGLLYGAVVYRTKIVDLWPKAATIYKAVGMPVNLTGLDLRNIDYQRKFTDGVPLLELHGEVLNKGKVAQAVPELRAALLGSDGKELYSWTFKAAASKLGPGEVSAFSSELPSPPVESQQLVVTFALGK